MGFLRRLLGGGDRPEDTRSDAGGAAGDGAPDDEERARELELARFDQERVDDLIRRQQRYANRSWTPPAQGGERRADDSDPAAG